MFDPYGGGVMAPPPQVVSPQAFAPQTIGPTPGFAAPPFAPQTAAPATTAPLYSGELPFAWEPGAYSLANGESAGVRFTKFVQKLDGEYTYLAGGNSARDLELHRVEVTSTFAWPLGGNLDSPVLLTPGFVYNNFSDGDFIATNGFPDDEFEAFLDAAWYPQFNDVLGGEFGLRTGVWSDFREVNSDSVRVLGRAAGAVRVTPRAEVLAGVVYLDRKRIKLLPVIGVRWRPTDNLRVDAVFPYPSVRKRLPSAGPTDWWLFVAGEYGGGSWTDREAPTGFDYNDIRVSLGLEFESSTRITGRFEVGYVFEREFYQPGAVVTEFEDTVMLRAGINL